MVLLRTVISTTMILRMMGQDEEVKDDVENDDADADVDEDVLRKMKWRMMIRFGMMRLRMRKMMILRMRLLKMMVKRINIYPTAMCTR